MISCMELIQCFWPNNYDSKIFGFMSLNNYYKLKKYSTVHVTKDLAYLWKPRRAISDSRRPDRSRARPKSGPTCQTIGPDMPDDRARHARQSDPTCPTSPPPDVGRLSGLSGPTSGSLSGPTSGSLSGPTSGRLSGPTSDGLSGLHDQPPMILQWTISEDHQP